MERHSFNKDSVIGNRKEDVNLSVQICHEKKKDNLHEYSNPTKMGLMKGEEFTVLMKT